MNDLQTLYDAWGTPAPPSRTAEARAALLARARRRRRAPLRLRLAAVAITGALAAAFALAVQDLDEGQIASAEVLERAAHAAETKPFVAPRPDQWIYTEDRFTSSDGGAPQTRREWRPASGEVRQGRLVPFDSYEWLASLPTDPDALLRWAYRQTPNVTGAGPTDDSEVYAILRNVLSGGVLPPELEAATFRAMKRIPRVTVSTVEVQRQRVISLAQTQGWLREELFLDPRTYAYRGQRGTVVRDATIDPAKAGNETGAIEKGHTATSLRIRTAIVDRRGER